jgi:hypothetical protein
MAWCTVKRNILYKNIVIIPVLQLEVNMYVCMYVQFQPEGRLDPHTVPAPDAHTHIPMHTHIRAYAHTDTHS